MKLGEINTATPRKNYDQEADNKESERDVYG